MNIHMYSVIFDQICNEFNRLSKDNNLNENESMLLKRISTNLYILSINSIQNIMLFKAHYLDSIKNDCSLLKQCTNDSIINLSDKTIILLENYEKELDKKTDPEDLKKIINKINETTKK